jgi:hypothetical protein
VTTSLFSLENSPVRTAVRFPLHLEIVLSTLEREYNAVTVDVSSSGVLFEGDELPPVGTPVTFLLKMPAAVMGGTEDVLLHSQGRIVRRTRTAGKSLAAALIENYTLKG